ncbi:class I SAM-dependent methyltransferase [Mycolicibacterium sp. 3033]|nr:class I SAM-dependent methyltransferase [Mycolicibacterium aurantiacum]
MTEFYDAYTKEEQVVLQTGVGTRRPALRRLYHALSGDVDPRDFVAVPPGGRVLDYGSGTGTYLSYFHARGVDIVGAEISDVMLDASERHGLRMHRVETFDVIPFPDAEFDVVYLMQVFEHLRGPRTFMKELSRILKPGGILHLALPNAASGWRKVFGANWVSGWFAPYHLVHYTKGSLARLAADHGLIVEASWSRTPESWFRLNSKAALHRRDNTVERPRSVIDSAPVRVLLMCLLRVIEIAMPERDCLVMSFRKV